MAQSKDSLWGGRFAGGPSEALEALSKSTHFDWRLATYDLKGTSAHLVALHAGGYLTKDELAVLNKAVAELTKRVEDGSFVPKATEEDVHAALERGLIQIAGAQLAGKIRAGRSRNDQIATLIRIFMLDAADAIEAQVLDYLDALCSQAENHIGVAMPGRTHFQLAQPVLLSHHLLAHAWPQVRNLQRLEDWRKRANRSAYGAGALAGSTLGLDPKLVAEELGLKGVSENSMDSTSSRDLVAEFVFILSLIGIDLSRISEEVIAWVSYEFGYATLADEFSTGSSIMPQKKNPDIAELTRGKSGRLIGNLTGLLATFKGLPLSYNRDLQEDKEPMFDSFDSLMLIFPAFIGMISTLTFDKERLEFLAPKGFSLATDVAEWLVKQGVVFRDAHEITGQLVQFCEANELELDQVSDEQLANVSKHLKPEVRKVLKVSGSIEARNGAGGTSSSQVIDQLVALRKLAPHRRS
ncbi:argininosuccinate lyase [Candidatus Aquiluna sp. IMCC13023]|uniref:argininosuccinate lyase n=1 Tax=Candidatus Aquiluna sp. IMCC13023 TaxID=1081644 RepID=UPI00025B37E7|nr:argininosuccinate lyase [Candidatus Aquiluna sp. IMCC13023]EIC92258.1 argininosuccinate lyase [Candidatus Aquiluna sp. IMCC13023]